jgi:hypothetical protein
MSNDDYNDDATTEAYQPAKPSGGLIPTAGGLAAILAVLAWIVLLLGIIQITVQLVTREVGSPALSFRSIVLVATSAWSALVAWGVLMLAAVIARYVAHRDEY